MNLPTLPVGDRLDASVISLPRAPVVSRVGIYDFSPGPLLGQRDAVVLPRNRREIRDHRDRVSPRRLAQPCEHRVLMVIDDKPGKTLGLAIARV